MLAGSFFSYFIIKLIITKIPSIAKTLESTYHIFSTFQIPVKSSDDTDSMKSSQRSQSESENAGDSCIPFPRTCGAKWCGVSTLVVFNRPPNARRLSLKHETGTPRSMSSLSLTPGLFGTTGYNSVSPHATTTPSPTNASGFPQLHHRHASNSITTFYFQDRWVSY